jgi:hypothetical protein
VLHVDPRNVGWRPIEGSSQELALAAPVSSLLLTGGRGWGKTETQLQRFRKRVGLGYGTHWRGIIFDREYKNLDDLVVKSKRMFLEDGGCRFLSSNSDYKWVWDTGEELLFRVAKSPDDYWSYHGHEYPFVGWNELTKYSNNQLYTKMLSVNRSGFSAVEHTPRLTGKLVGNMTDFDEWNYHGYEHYEGRPFQAGDYKTFDGRPLPEIPLEVVSTTNPYGAGHNWVKREFIDPAPYGKIISKTVRIFDPKTKEDIDVTRKHMTLFGTFRENPYLSPMYIAGLYEETDENIIKAWLNGDWDIVAGGALDDKWRRNVHVLPRFKIPKGWIIDRALDWGSTHPFSVGWFAEANGEEVTLPDGRVFAPKAGTIIQIAEIYGTKQIGTNVGLKKGAKEIAKAILEVEQELRQGGWIVGKVYEGPADNEISSVREVNTDSIEKLMAEAGVTWEKSDKGSGSRVNGLQLFRDRLQASIDGEDPGLYFMDNCRASIATIPVLPRDDDRPDDVDTTAEDHAYDMVRYRLLKGNMRAANVIKVNFPR